MLGYFHARGKRFEQQLDLMVRVWNGEPLSVDSESIGPTPLQSGGPQLLIGGGVPAAIQRVGRWGAGYIDGASPVQEAVQNYRIAETAWREAGRPGKPLFLSAAWWSLGPNGTELGTAYLNHLSSATPELAQYFREHLCATPEAIKAAIRAYEAIGVDELCFMPTVAELDQLDRFMDAIASVTS